MSLFFYQLPHDTHVMLQKMLQHNSPFTRYSWSFFLARKQGKLTTILPFNENDVKKIMKDYRIYDKEQFLSFVLDFWKYYPDSRDLWLSTLIKKDCVEIVISLLNNQEIDINLKRFYAQVCHFESMALYDYIIQNYQDKIDCFNFLTIKFLILHDKKRIIQYLSKDRQLIKKCFNSSYWLSLAVNSRHFVIFKLLVAASVKHNLTDILNNILFLEDHNIDITEYYLTLLNFGKISKLELLNFFCDKYHFELFNWLKEHYITKEEWNEFLAEVNPKVQFFLNQYNDYISYLDDDNLDEFDDFTEDVDNLTEDVDNLTEDVDNFDVNLND